MKWPMTATTSRPDGTKYDALDPPIPLQSRSPAETQGLPPLDRSITIRNLCVVGIGLTYALGIVCIVLADRVKYLSTHSQRMQDESGDFAWTFLISMPSSARIIVDLALNAAITLCTEVLGYIHSTSLRWALWRQQRLPYSSTLRLFSTASVSAANSWYANLCMGVTLIVGYTAASQIFMQPVDQEGWHFDPAPGQQRVLVNGLALLILGVALLIQAAVAQTCLWKQSKRIPTWSSNVLTIALATLHDPLRPLQHTANRSMLSAFDAKSHATSTRHPVTSQPTLRATDPSTRHVTRIAWCLPPITLIWAIVVIALQHTLPSDTGPKQIFLTSEMLSSLGCSFVLVAGFQTFLTMSLHSIELLVNRSRDEMTWRYAYAFRKHSEASIRSGIGAPKAYNSLLSAFSSWQSLALFILKPIAHWLFGSSLTQSVFSSGFAYASMHASYAFGLSATLLVVAFLANALAKLPPRGPIPSTWGHLQTLVDLIDDWGTGDSGKLYWGDKGEDQDGIRRAGTCCTTATMLELGEIKLDRLYH